MGQPRRGFFHTHKPSSVRAPPVTAVGRFGFSRMNRVASAIASQRNSRATTKTRSRSSGRCSCYAKPSNRGAGGRHPAQINSRPGGPFHRFANKEVAVPVDIPSPDDFGDRDRFPHLPLRSLECELERKAFSGRDFGKL
jgi:hypothetical protein